MVKPPQLRPWNPFREEWHSYEKKAMARVEKYLEKAEREYQAEQVTPNFAQILGVLTPREEQIIRMRLGIAGEPRPMTFDEIGRKFAVGRQRIWQIHRRAWKRLTDPEYVRDQYVRYKESGTYYAGEPPSRAPARAHHPGRG